MKNNAIKWLYAVPKRKKLYILALMLVQALNGASGVLYALFLRNIVDSATDHDRPLFWRNVVFTVLLVAAQIGIRAVIRWLNELSKATFENIFKERLMRNILHKDFASVNAVHSGEWQNRLTNDTVVVSDSYVEILPGLAGMVVKLISALVMIIILKNADFTYYPNVEDIKALTKDDQPIVLNSISVEIKKGEYIAFTGHSGCGKSTVLKLLMSIYKLDGGIDTLLGERGTGLSEGQMQRIAVARAVFSSCPILLLDEATSALDENTERQLLENLRSMTDKTVIIVTHRPAALEICDRVLEFKENGVFEKNG